MQISERHSFEKVSFGGKMRRKREISQINGRKKKTATGCSSFQFVRRVTHFQFSRRVWNFQFITSLVTNLF